MLIQKLNQTINYLNTKTSIKPKIGIILGSGLGKFASEIQVEQAIPYEQIPHFLAPSIDGHQGKMIFGHIGNLPIVCLQGRIHFYEGHSMSDVVYPMRTLARLGIHTLIVTNAAGGLAPDMEPGDFMIISDHINLMGTNPLIGLNENELGPRFPDMSEAYSLELQEKLEGILNKRNVRFHKGVYCGLTGPTYETPSEVRHLRLIGGSAVGMSTVPEVIIANHMGVKVCGISCITNKAAGLSQHKLSHSEVTETTKRVEAQFSIFVKELVISLMPQLTLENL